MPDTFMKRETRVQLVGIVLLLLLPVAGWAQPGPPPDPDIPITGIEYLLGGGVILGLRAIMARFKSKKE